jgi:hypothetical protein
MLLNRGLARLSSVTSANLWDLTDMTLHRHKTCKEKFKDIGLLISAGTEHGAHNVNVCRYRTFKYGLAHIQSSCTDMTKLIVAFRKFLNAPKVTVS